MSISHISEYYILDCIEPPFSAADGVEVYYDSPYAGLPLPKLSKIYYRCLQGHFPDGKTWRVGVCKKDGSGKFSIAPQEDCTTEAVVKTEDGEERVKVRSGVKREYQPGGR